MWARFQQIGAGQEINPRGRWTYHHTISAFTMKIIIALVKKIMQIKVGKCQLGDICCCKSN
jgi:hypothetical protein